MHVVSEGVHKLVRQPLRLDEIVAVVAEVFCVDRSIVVERQGGRRISNQSRKVAMYCAQKEGGFTQKEIAAHFNLAHTGSVSSAIQSVGEQIESGSLKSCYRDVLDELNVVKLT